MRNKYLIFSSLGLKMKDGHDPIYFIANEFPPVYIHLFSSDEPIPKDKSRSVENNVEEISLFMNKIKVDVNHTPLTLNEFSDNIIMMSKKIIESHVDYPENEIILDLSAGRGPISHALARTGQLCQDLLNTYGNEDIAFTCVIKSKDKEIVSFKLNDSVIPINKPAELLKIYNDNEKQEQLRIDLGWSSQSDVSKSLSDLTRRGIVNEDKRLTILGAGIRELLLAYDRMR